MADGVLAAARPQRPVAADVAAPAPEQEAPPQEVIVTASKRDTFDSHLLTLWLNVASGSVGLGEPLDADGDGSTETTVGAFVLAAETTRNSVSPSSTQLPALKDVIERVNETH